MRVCMAYKREVTGGHSTQGKKGIFLASVDSGVTLYSTDTARVDRWRAMAHYSF